MKRMTLIAMMTLAVFLCGAPGLYAAATGEKVTTIHGDGPYMPVYDEDTMSSDDAGGLATQQSVKAYVDNTVDALIHVDTVEITNAELLALRAAPKDLVAAPGAGYVLELVGAVIILDYGSAACTESTDNLVIQYGGGTDATAAIETTGFIDQTADTIAVIAAATIATVAASGVANDELELFNSGDGEFGTCTGSTVTVQISYRVHATGL